MVTVVGGDSSSGHDSSLLVIRIWAKGFKENGEKKKREREREKEKMWKKKKEKE